MPVVLTFEDLEGFLQGFDAAPEAALSSQHCQGLRLLCVSDRDRRKMLHFPGKIWPVKSLANDVQ
jgi:hypothetical protein